MTRLVALALGVGLLVLVEPFTKASNYMSLEGYARWQRFLQTRTWER